jgi:hypothetical protein
MMAAGVLGSSAEVTLSSTISFGLSAAARDRDPLLLAAGQLVRVARQMSVGV